MKCEIAILSGARAGTRETLDKAYIGLGRHPMSDIRFDAEKDIDASTRHAAILLSGAGYVLRDLGSTNGTFVNGHRVSGDVQLSDGDVIRCGVHGPEVSFKVLLEAQEAAMLQAMHAATGGEKRSSAPKAAPAKPAPAAAPAAPAAGPAAAAPSKTSILRAEIATQKSRFRAITAFLLIVLVGSASVLVWTNQKSNAERQRAEARADSLARVMGQMQAAKKEADSVIGALHRSLAAATDPAQRAALQAQMTAAVSRKANIERSIATADQVDYSAILNSNSRGVAVIYVQVANDSATYVGTGFNTDPSGRLITNKHVVAGEHFDKTALQVAVQFSGSAEVLRARVAGVSPTSDIALVQITDSGPFPTIAGLAQDASPRAGDPIVLLGFPGYSGDRHIPHATPVIGSVDEIVTDSLLRLEAYSGTGASGSPILDRNGRVIGIEFGGLVGSGGRTVLALPIRRALPLLNH